MAWFWPERKVPKADDEDTETKETIAPTEEETDSNDEDEMEYEVRHITFPI